MVLIKLPRLQHPCQHLQEILSELPFIGLFFISTNVLLCTMTIKTFRFWTKTNKQQTKRFILEVSKMDGQDFSLCNLSSFLAACQLFTILLPMIKHEMNLQHPALNSLRLTLHSNVPSWCQIFGEVVCVFQRTRRRVTLSVWRDASWRGGSRAKRKAKWQGC